MAPSGGDDDDNWFLYFSDNLSNILSGLYAMFLVVLGASIPIAKVFAVDIAIQTLEVGSQTN